MIQVGISNNGRGRIDYSINGQLDFGGKMEGRILEIVFSSCLYGGLSALTTQQHAQIRQRQRVFCKGTTGLVQLALGTIVFVTWRIFFSTRGLLESTGARTESLE